MQPLGVLQEYFGHESFRGQQLEIIERVLAGGHSLVIMPTGMGKSLCYQIPAILLCPEPDDPVGVAAPHPLTLVISPLIALMKDQVDSLRRRGISASFINSSLTRSVRERRYQDVATGQYSLLYVTPERFRKQEFLDVIKQREIRVLAVDEAHCISEWGHDFRPDYTRLGEIRDLVGNPTTIALTATATPDVQTDIVRQLNLTAADTQLFHEGIDRPNLHLDVLDAWEDDEKLEQILSIKRENPGTGIVYFTLIKTLMRFSDKLWELDIPHLTYHGDIIRRLVVPDATACPRGVCCCMTNVTWRPRWNSFAGVILTPSSTNASTTSWNTNSNKSTPLESIGSASGCIIATNMIGGWKRRCRCSSATALLKAASLH
jgi:ATP-dependent DNA helicase RecQ